MNVWRPVELALAGAARIAWPLFQSVNRRIPSTSFHPAWAPAPLLKSAERSQPNLGWPRSTDSLCPECVKETRQQILSGAKPIESLIHEKNGDLVIIVDDVDGDGTGGGVIRCPAGTTTCSTMRTAPQPYKDPKAPKSPEVKKQ